MRRGARFSKRRIERWLESGRGAGIGQEYRPLHQVTRADPSSRGRSRIYFSHFLRRACHFLSDAEYVTFLSAHLLEGLFDCREQYPLSFHDSQHELTHYSGIEMGAAYPGTLAAAGRLEFRHPLLRDSTGCALWPMTTDLLIAWGSHNKASSLQAISVKRNTPRTRRTWELLAVEESYWRSRGVPWQLVTVEDFLPGVFNALMCTAAYALSEWQARPAQLYAAANLIRALEGSPFQHVLLALGRAPEGAPMRTQELFWQAVWQGHVRFDLRQPIRANTPIRLVDSSTFRRFCPLVDRVLS